MSNETRTVTPLTDEEVERYRVNHQPDSWRPTACSACRESWPCGGARIVATLDAFRAAALPTSTEGLDVERLAEALYWTLADPAIEEWHGEGDQRVWLRHARTIRARLASPSPSPTETPEPTEEEPT